MATMRAGALSGAVLLAACAPAEPALHLPADLERFDPALRSLMEERAQALHREPRDARAHAELGMVYEANRLWGLAAEAFARAHALAPSEPLWIHHAALALHHAGDSELALIRLRAASPIIADSAPAEHLLGVLELQDGSFEAALEAFDRTCALAPEACEGWVGRGEALLALGRAEEAALAFERGLSFAPEYDSAHYLLGLAYRELGRVEEARRQLARGRGGALRYMADELADELEGLRVGRLERMAEVRRLLAAGEARLAMGELKAHLASDPDDLEALELRGRILFDSKMWGAAEENFDHMVELDPRNGETLSLRGLARLRAKRDSEAMADLVTAVELSPDSVSVHVNLVQAYLERGRGEDALAAAAAARALVGDHPVLQRLVQGLEKEGEE
jgi:tetratricopeptide (TPR) repeat protein